MRSVRFQDEVEAARDIDGDEIDEQDALCGLPAKEMRDKLEVSERARTHGDAGGGENGEGGGEGTVGWGGEGDGNHDGSRNTDIFPSGCGGSDGLEGGRGDSGGGGSRSSLHPPPSRARDAGEGEDDGENKERKREEEEGKEEDDAMEKSWRGAIEAAAVAAMVFGVYMRTISPTITGGDSGEVMAAACSAAPAHPPGYPLFVILARAAMWVLRGFGENAAYRVNVMCSAMTAAGVYNLHRAARALTRCGAAASMAAGMYGLSPLIWNNAMQAEVFSLNNLFVCLITNILVRYLNRRDGSSNSLAYLGAFVSGLGLTNQHTLLLYLAVIVPTVLWSGRSTLLRPLPFLLLTAAFTAGLMPYSLTWFIRGCSFPWAEKDGEILGKKLCPWMERVPKYTWGDSRSFQGFLNHVLRRDYGTLSLAAGGASVHGKPVSFLTGLWFYLEDAAGPRLDERVRGGGTVSHDGQLLYFGVPFAVWGITACFSACSPGRWRGKHAASKRSLIAAYTLYLVVFHALANLPIRVPLFRAVHARFWQMPNSTLFIFVGMGFARCLRSTQPIIRWCFAALAVYLQVGNSTAFGHFHPLPVPS
jgi:hypothetical protein